MEIVLEGLVYVLAAIGVITVVFLVWCMIDEAQNPSLPYPMPVGAVTPSSRNTDAIEYLDNEVRGQIRYDRSIRGRVATEPTLKGRVDMIEKHLGILVSIQPAVEAKLKVVKKRK